MAEGLHDHALNNIRYIREAMERATAFTSIPGWGGLIIGTTAIATAVIGSRFVAQPRLWTSTWLAEAVVAALIAAVTMSMKARRANVALTSTQARRFFISYSAPLIAGAVITIAMMRLDIYKPLPAIWLSLYGASFISSGAFSIRLVPIMGVCYMVFGIAAAFLPLWIGNILMGSGFGGLHVIFGYLIARRYGG
jgi:hypothetical protein